MLADLFCKGPDSKPFGLTVCLSDLNSARDSMEWMSLTVFKKNVYKNKPDGRSLQTLSVRLKERKQFKDKEMLWGKSLDSSWEDYYDLAK